MDNKSFSTSVGDYSYNNGDCGGSTVTRSISPIVRNFYTEKELKGMSLCFAVMGKRATYIAADSRSSIGYDKFGTFDYRRHALVDDNYVKLLPITVGDKTVVAFSTGENNFDGKSFADIIKSYSINGDDIDSNIFEIIKCFRRFLSGEDMFRIDFLYYADGKNSVTHIFYNNGDDGPKTVDNIFRQGTEDIYHIASGVGWGKDLSKKIFYCDNDQIMINEVNSVFDTVQTVAPYFDNTIGGTIRIAKLTPSGFTWLQGEPT